MSFSPVPPFLRMYNCQASIIPVPHGIPPFHSGSLNCGPGHVMGIAVTKPTRVVFKAVSPCVEKKLCHQLSLIAS